MKNVLLIGGLGRIGKILANYLSSFDFNVSIISRNEISSCCDTTKINSKVKIYYFDYFDFIKSENIIKENNIVIHLADKSIPSSSEENPYDGITNDIVGTLKIFNICQKYEIKKFIFPSSGGTVYGEKDTFPITEETLPVPLSYHGCQKLSIEHYLNASNKYSKTELIILRISNPYGMSFSGKAQGIIDVCINSLLMNKKITIWGDGHIVRDYIYIDDLIDAFYKVIITDKINGIYNIGSGLGNSINDIINELSKYFDLKNNIVFLPNRIFDIKKIVLDISKSENMFNWKPEISLEDGIKKIVNE